MTQVLQPTISEVLQFMTHNDLKMYKPVGSKASIQTLVNYGHVLNEMKYSKGVVFVSPSKEQLAVGQGFIITSYETLHEKYNQLTHWTPNTFRGGTYYDFKSRILKGHTKDNLKQVSVFGIDIDTKETDPYEIFLACDELELPRPNVILETPNGYQAFFVLETPFYIHNQKEYKSLRVAERIANNLVKALKKHLPIDIGCNPLGFYRIPNDNNILYFNDEPVNTNELITWSIKFEKENPKPIYLVSSQSNAEALDMTATAWYEALINATGISKGHHGASRNNTLLTLAIANYVTGKSYEEAYDELDQFNSNLNVSLSKREFERTLKSAYSGKYQGPKRDYVEGLLEMWTDGQAKFIGGQGWYKFKKERVDRVRSHYEEREEDILLHLKACISPENPFLTGSLKELAESFGMALSTLKEVLKRSKCLVKRVNGNGRYASTMITTKVMLLRHLIHNRKTTKQSSQLAIRELLGASEVIFELFGLPNLDKAIRSIELPFANAAKISNAPPTRFIS